MLTDETRDAVAAELFAAESQLDAAMGKVADLMGGVARMHRAGEASMLATQKPLTRLASMQQLLADARLKLTGVHGDLANILPRAAKDMAWDCPCVRDQHAEERAVLAA